MTQRHVFNLQKIHSSWKKCIQEALKTLPNEYLEELYTTLDWLPGPHHIFNAFSTPVEEINYILLGESPYPRASSANGFAFWDAAVKSLWSETGLSKPVNKATSLRNIIKMLLIAEGLLSPTHTGQAHIAQIDKKHLLLTNQDLFENLLKKGFLLLNAVPVLRAKKVKQDAKMWLPFIKHILLFLAEKRPDVKILLFGKIATILLPHLTIKNQRLIAEHPYNLSFINNNDVLDFFRPLHLLKSL